MPSTYLFTGIPYVVAVTHTCHYAIWKPGQHVAECFNFSFLGPCRNRTEKDKILKFTLFSIARIPPLYLLGNNVHHCCVEHLYKYH